MSVELPRNSRYFSLVVTFTWLHSTGTNSTLPTPLADLSVVLTSCRSKWRKSPVAMRRVTRNVGFIHKLLKGSKGKEEGDTSTPCSPPIRTCGSDQAHCSSDHPDHPNSLLAPPHLPAVECQLCSLSRTSDKSLTAKSFLGGCPPWSSKPRAPLPSPISRLCAPRPAAWTPGSTVRMCPSCWWRRPMPAG